MQSVRPGTIVGGQFRVEGIIGSGAMGIVARAKDIELDRDVAIKLVRPELTNDETIERFRREAKTMARIDNRHVVRILSFGSHKDVPFFAMEFIEGKTLEEVINDFGSNMAFDYVVGVLDQIASGLEAIHAAGARHGDIKPSNILVDSEFRIAIADLGLAEWIREQRTEASQITSGTPAYLAPEAITQAEVEPEFQDRIDVYSLGCLAFEMLTGRLPFDANNPYATMRAHVYDDVPTASDIRPDLPHEIDDVILRSMAKDPAIRPNAREFRAALKSARAASRKKPSEPILVVDDDPSFRQLVRFCLEEAFESIQVVEAADGEEAMKMLGASSYAAVITDLDLPGMNGVELTASINAEFGSSLPVMVITGEGGAADWRLLQSLGARHFFVKPLEPTSFVTQLRNNLKID